MGTCTTWILVHVLRPRLSVNAQPGVCARQGSPPPFAPPSGCWTSHPGGTRTLGAKNRLVPASRRCCGAKLSSRSMFVEGVR